MDIAIYVVTLLLIPVLYLIKGVLSLPWNMYRIRKALLRDFPTPEYHWLYGHLKAFPGFSEEGLHWSNANVVKYPRYYVFLIGPTALLQLNHPETIKQITNTTEPKPMSFGGSYRGFAHWIGDGLLLSSGSKWFRNRRLLTPAFHFDILKPYVTVYNNCVELLIEKFESTAANCSIEIFKPVSYCTFDILLQCAFSINKEVQKRGENEKYVKVVNETLRQLTDYFMVPYYQIHFLYYMTKQGKAFAKNCEFSHRFAEDVIEKRKRKLKESDTVEELARKRYVDFLDILLLARDEDGHGLTLREIRDEVETFMFEGYDTTTSGISWILYNLAAHPDIQARAREEVDALMDGRDSDKIEWEDLAELPYLTRCIKESMRLHSTSPNIGRELTRPIPMDDKVIPAGTFVYMNIWNLHHNAVIWENPMVYDPERFLPEKMAQMDSHAFLPFSAGPRNCIGQNFAMNEMKTIVARLLRRFEMKVDSSKPIELHPDVAILRARHGIHLFFNARE